MIPQIISIMTPSIDLRAFAKNSEAALGYNPIKYAESSPRQFSSEAKLIAGLSAFNDSHSTDPIEALRKARSILKHLSYSFLVGADPETLFEVASKTDLKITPGDNENIAFISGSIYEWREATFELCQVGILKNARILLDKIVLYFEKIGLAELWSEHRKVKLQDGTLKLELKE